MDALERNNFVVTHASAEFFDKDLEYYKKLFPTSRLIKDLERCPEFRKKELDARMLHEMLASQNICHECILENRGIITMAQKLKDEEEAKALQVKAKTVLLEVDLSGKFDFNQVKELAEQAGVTLQGKSKADLVASIEQWKKTLPPPAPVVPESGTPEAGNTDQGPTDEGTPEAGNTDQGPTDEGNPEAGNADQGNTESPDKKKEGQE